MANPVQSRDLPSRLIHWFLAACIVANLFLIEEGDPPHRWIGYLAVALVFMRTLWSLIRKWFPSQPHVRSLHHPWTTFIYVVIWALIIALGVSGWMLSNLDAYFGDETLEELHESFSDGVQILVLVHLAGVFLDSIRKKRKTWMIMIKS